ncbi:uncharacterized protein LY89DRAFT_87033 [Mollisia scopiformis]|uniref:4'-phosphopantetheinyl transferase domain-containing protein n=1 Tax=Mollisia scopiformis TaxID=149040 RepID=A0A194X8R3_MOLSC|nr:uncharacterized protein LY89DRAFT_87033 [Mollisia scopiformis]KUJ16555.1 hypothetical protein LY89DRAFT_87033 [Mollisia scopiformis]
MPKPFPFSLAIATDICSVSRIRELLARKNGNSLIRRVLRPEEILENKARCDDALEKWRKVANMKELHAWKREKGSVVVEKTKGISDEVVARHLQRMIEQDTPEAEKSLAKVATFMAGRFAAKEAIIKAHEGRLTFHDIIIRRPPDDALGSKAPLAIVLPQSGKEEDGQVVKISISHDTDFATAVCLAPTGADIAAAPAPSVRYYQSSSLATRHLKVGTPGGMLPSVNDALKRTLDAYARAIQIVKVHYGSHRENAVLIEDFPPEISTEQLNSLFQSRPINVHIQNPKEDSGMSRWAIAIFKTEYEAHVAASTFQANEGHQYRRGHIGPCTHLKSSSCFVQRSLVETNLEERYQDAVDIIGPGRLTRYHTVEVISSTFQPPNSCERLRYVMFHLKSQANGFCQIAGKRGPDWVCGYVLFHSKQEALDAIARYDNTPIDSPWGLLQCRLRILADQMPSTGSQTKSSEDGEVKSQHEEVQSDNIRIAECVPDSGVELNSPPQVGDERIV